MKVLLLFSVFLSFESMASSSAIYCKNPYTNRPQKLLSQDFDTCRDELYMGEVCFTGKRAKVIQIINSKEVAESFDGTDGESVRNPRYHGKYEIAYDQIDLANDYREKVVIRRCTREFFR